MPGPKIESNHYANETSTSSVSQNTGRLGPRLFRAVTEQVKNYIPRYLQRIFYFSNDTNPNYHQQVKKIPEAVEKLSQNDLDEVYHKAKNQLLIRTEDARINVSTEEANTSAERLNLKRTLGGAFEALKENLSCKTDILIKHALNHTRPIRDKYIQETVDHIKPIVNEYIKNIVDNVKLVGNEYIKNTVNNTVNNIKLISDKYVESKIKHAKLECDKYLKDKVATFKSILEDNGFKNKVSNNANKNNRISKSSSGFLAKFFKNILSVPIKIIKMPVKFFNFIVVKIQNRINNVLWHSAASFYRQKMRPKLDQVIHSLEPKSTQRSLRGDGLPAPQERRVETPQNSVPGSPKK